MFGVISLILLQLVIVNDMALQQSVACGKGIGSKCEVEQPRMYKGCIIYVYTLHTPTGGLG